MTIFHRMRDVLAQQGTPAVELADDQTANTKIETDQPAAHNAAAVPETINVIATQVDDIPAHDAGTMLVFATTVPDELIARTNGSNGYHPADWNDLLGQDSSTGAEGDDDTIHLPRNWPDDEMVVQPAPRRPKSAAAKTAGSRRHKLLQARRKAFLAQAEKQRARAELLKNRKPRRVLFTERQFAKFQNPQLFRAKTRSRLVRRVGTKLDAAVRAVRIEQAVVKSRELTHSLTHAARRQSVTTKVRWNQRAKVVRFLQQQSAGEQHYSVCHHEPRLSEPRTADGVGELLIFSQPETAHRGDFIRCQHCEFVSYDGNLWEHPEGEVAVVRGRVHGERPRSHFHLMTEEDLAALTNRPVGHCGQQTKCLNVTANGHRWGSSLRKFELKRFGRPSLFRRNQQHGVLPRHRPQPDRDQHRFMLEQEDVFIDTRFWFPEFVELEDGGWILDEDGHYFFDKPDFSRVTYHSTFGFIPEQLWDYLDQELDEVTALEFDNLKSTCDFIILTFNHWARLPAGLVEMARQLAVAVFDSGQLSLMMSYDRKSVAALVTSVTPLPRDEFYTVRVAAGRFVQSAQQPNARAVKA